MTGVFVRASVACVVTATSSPAVSSDGSVSGVALDTVAVLRSVPAGVPEAIEAVTWNTVTAPLAKVPVDHVAGVSPAPRWCRPS